jgi:diacylglycerol kinase family enzyme
VRATGLRARSVRIEASKPIPVHADNHLVGVTPAEIGIRPAALAVFA